MRTLIAPLEATKCFCRLALALLVASVGAVGCGERKSELAAGPLRYDGFRVGIGAPVDVDTAVTFGLSEVENTTEKRIVLEAVHVVGLDEEVTIVGMFAADRTGVLDASSHTFPPVELERSKLKRIRGYVVAPGRAAQLLIGAKTVASGVHGWRGLDVVYTFDGERYSLHLPHELTLCAPRREYLGKSCGFPP